jgi:hypothetical protein
MIFFSIVDISDGTRTNISRIQTLYAYLAVQQQGDPKKITKLCNYLNGPHKSDFCFQNGLFNPWSRCSRSSAHSSRDFRIWSIRDHAPFRRLAVPTEHRHPVGLMSVITFIYSNTASRELKFNGKFS